MKGEIIKIDWQNETKIDSAKISLIFNKFTAEALKNNKTLSNNKVTTYIEVSTENFFEDMY